MAKLQVLIAMTLNGSVPARNDSLLQWIQNSNDGFPCWRDRYTRMLYPGYPLVDLICDKEQSAPSDIYLAEIYDDSSAELLRGLSLYHLIDEMVIFLLPVISSETVPVSKHISTDKWELVRTKTFTCKKLLMTKKKLPVRFTGQHFTIDKVLIKDAIRQANISNQDTVLDIGAGKGFLTVHLLKIANNVVAIENDTALVEHLRKF